MLLVVRHAEAGDKSTWKGPDALRPLSPSGHLQAEGLVVRLEDYPIERILCSPTLRCHQTVQPLARDRMLKIEPVPALGVEASPAQLLELFWDLELRSSVLCTHGEGIGLLLTRLIADALVVEDRLDWPKGSTWLLERIDQRQVCAAASWPRSSTTDTRASSAPERRPPMSDTPADDAQPTKVHGNAARRRSAGIYGTIVTSAVVAAGGGHLATGPLAVAVVVTLLVYWAAEGYADLLGEQARAGRLPTWSHVRASLAAIWPMVTASYLPLLSLLVARVLGADTKTAATVALVVAIALLLVHGWVGGRASQLHGLPLLAVTLIAGAFGVTMILLKLVVTH